MQRRALLLLIGVFAASLAPIPSRAQTATECSTDDDNHCEIWATRTESPRGDAHYDRGLVVKTSPDGAVVYVTGFNMSQDINDADITTVAYAADSGGQIWTRRYSETKTTWDHMSDLVVSPDGERLFVVGGHNPNTTNNRWRMLAYRARDGHLLWRARGTRRRGTAEAATTDPSGSVLFVTGTAHVKDQKNQRDLITVAYSTETGEVLWRESYNGAASQRDAGLDIAFAGGRLYIMGTSEGDDAIRDFKTVALAYEVGRRRADLLWKTATHSYPRHYPFGGDMELAADADLTYLSASYVFGNGSETSNTDTYTYKTVALATDDGRIVWDDVFEMRAQSWPGNPYLALDRDANTLILTGLPPETAGPDTIVTRALEGATGTELWRQEYTNEVQTFASDVVVDSGRGRVYVMATDSRAGPFFTRDYRTIAYDSSDGAELWRAAYPGESGTEATANDIALSPLGRIFVTGSISQGEDEDFLTVSYDP